jgi:Snake toxin and toxin-like protein
VIFTQSLGSSWPRHWHYMHYIRVSGRPCRMALPAYCMIDCDQTVTAGPTARVHIQTRCSTTCKQVSAGLPWYEASLTCCASPLLACRLPRCPFCCLAEYMHLRTQRQQIELEQLSITACAMSKNGSLCLIRQISVHVLICLPPEVTRHNRMLLVPSRL